VALVSYATAAHDADLLDERSDVMASAKCWSVVWISGRHQVSGLSVDVA
jgi:hypothetical protein